VTATQPIRLNTPVEDLPFVTAAQARALRRLGLTNVGRLIRHHPLRYEQVQGGLTVAELRPGMIASVQGQIIAARPVRTRRRPCFEAVLADETGQLRIQWFNQLYLARRIHPGMTLEVEGRVRTDRSGCATMANPRWRALEGDSAPPSAPRVKPVYPASEELPSWAIERLIAQLLPLALPLVRDHLPEAFRRKRNLPALGEALRMAHAPANLEEAQAARRRLAYDELLLLELGVHMKRWRHKRTLRAPALRYSEAIDRHIRARLPFALTPGQARAAQEIARDLSQEAPANRLLQGDVGSGKTAVALYAMLLATASRQQSALMAPTELLAEQHLATLRSMLAGSDVQLALLTGSLGAQERSAALARIERGEVDIVVGTHALLTEQVRFHSLALVVIDEQHRFGVHQRATLRAKAEDASSAAHTLVMTATPIPRTLSLTIFGDLDVTTIEDMPPGRKPVKTLLHSRSRRGAVYAQVRQALERGEQAFVVAPTIEGAQTKTVTAVRELARELQAGPLAGLRVATLHSRLARSTRETIMERFRAGRVQALVATTVIEVGVDVPGATIMVVEDADRFGLAQLHQLRGRVGRGDKPGVCHLIADPSTPEAMARLKALTKLRDGFALAEEDLKLRGPGEALGLKQSGAPPFRVADLARDTDLLLMARRDAAQWIERSPLLDKEEEQLLRRRLLRTHGQWLGVADVA